MLGDKSGLILSDIISLTKTRDRDLEINNSRENSKKVKSVLTKTNGINLNEYRKAKKYHEELKSIRFLLSNISLS